MPCSMGLVTVRLLYPTSRVSFVCAYGRATPRSGAGGGNVSERSSTRLVGLLFLLDMFPQAMDAIVMSDNPQTETVFEEPDINEASYLREEDSTAKYDARMAALDRADQKGDWWRHG